MRLKRLEGGSEFLGILLLLFGFLIMCLLIWFLFQSDAKPSMTKETLIVTNTVIILITIITLISIIFVGFKFFAQKK